MSDRKELPTVATLDAERCETCRFWLRASRGDMIDLEAGMYLSDLLDEADPLSPCVGRCRRYPPAIVGELVKESIEMMARVHKARIYGGGLIHIEGASRHPVTLDGGWCGEWRVG